MSHINAAECPSCDAFTQQAHPTLQAFAKAFRASCPEAHISCAYRNQVDQESDLAKGVTRASFGQSPHNYQPSLALDWFRLTQAGGAAFDAPWYEAVLKPAAQASGLVWGGSFSSIHDLPHVEIADWRQLSRQ